MTMTELTERQRAIEVARKAKVALVAYITVEHPWLEDNHCFRCDALWAIQREYHFGEPEEVTA